MGAKLAVTAYQDWPWRLDKTPMLVLVRMALTAKDADPEPIYWAGWRPLAYALGCDMPPENDHSDDAQRLRRNAERSVERAVASLVKAGAISRAAAGRRGAQAEYVLNLTTRSVDK